MKECFYCERQTIKAHTEKIKDGFLLKTRDHVIPSSKGGDDSTVVCACHECNQWKDNLSLERWEKVVEAELKRSVKKRTKRFSKIELKKILFNIKILKYLLKKINK